MVSDGVAALDALFQAGHLETRLALAGQLGHAHAVIVWGVGDSGLVGRMGGGDEEHAVKLETVRRSPGDRQVGLVNGVERASENRQSHVSGRAASYALSIFTELTRTSFDGRSCALRGACEIFFTTSYPSVTSPNTAVVVVQQRRGRHGDEELAAVGIGPGVGHREHARLGVLQLGVKLVGEFVSGTAAAGALRIAALDHEIRNHAMKNGAVVERLPGLGSFRQADEVLDRARRLVGEQLDLERAFRGIECGVDVVGHHCDCSNSPTRVRSSPPSMRLL